MLIPKTADYVVLKIRLPPWKTVTVLRSGHVVSCLSTEDCWFDLLQWNDSSWTLLRIGYEFLLVFRSWRTKLPVSARWRTHTENLTMQTMGEFFRCRIFSRNLWPPSIRMYIAVGFLSLGGFEEICAKTNRTHFKKWKSTELSISSATTENSSPNCFKHDESGECTHRWTRWHFQGCFLFFYFNVVYLLTENVTGRSCVTFRSPCTY